MVTLQQSEEVLGLVENPYLKEFQRLLPLGAPLSWHERLLWMYDTKNQFLPQTRERGRMVAQYSWAIPSEEALTMIAAHSPLVEMGAGAGYWAALLAQKGADIIAYDIRPLPKDGDIAWPVYGEMHEAIRWFDVQQGEPPVLGHHADRSLFLCWPHYSHPMASDALTYYAGDTVIYIGEEAGDITGDVKFHEMLEESWDQIDGLALPQWDGFHDRLFVYRRM